MSEMTQEIQDEVREASSDVAPVESATVGKSLRAARESAALSVDDVAQSLKFSPRQVELLEADNYAALPGMTIVRGFVRSYAKLLKLDAEGLLRLLDDRTPPMQADVRPPANMGIADDTQATRQFSFLASAAIVVALAALLLGLWHFVGPSVKTVNLVGERPAIPAVAAPPEPALPAPPAAEQGMPPASSAPVAPPVVPSIESVVPALKFVFEGRAWLEVVDANKKVLHTGENQGGTQVSLTGAAPFDVVVGNAARVKLTYGEREIDLVPHTRAEVARLKVE